MILITPDRSLGRKIKEPTITNKKNQVKKIFFKMIYFINLCHQQKCSCNIPTVKYDMSYGFNMKYDMKYNMILALEALPETLTLPKFSFLQNQQPSVLSNALF